jgi:hypothetical protein
MKPCETHGRPDDGDGEKVINRNRCLESAVFWMKVLLFTADVVIDVFCLSVRLLKVLESTKNFDHDNAI